MTAVYMCYVTMLLLPEKGERKGVGDGLLVTESSSFQSTHEKARTRSKFNERGLDFVLLQGTAIWFSGLARQGNLDCFL